MTTREDLEKIELENPEHWREFFKEVSAIHYGQLCQMVGEHLSGFGVEGIKIKQKEGSPKWLYDGQGLPSPSAWENWASTALGIYDDPPGKEKKDREEKKIAAAETFIGLVEILLRHGEKLSPELQEARDGLMEYGVEMPELAVFLSRKEAEQEEKKETLPQAKPESVDKVREQMKGASEQEQRRDMLALSVGLIEKQGIEETIDALIELASGAESGPMHEQLEKVLLSRPDQEGVEDLSLQPAERIRLLAYFIIEGLRHPGSAEKERRESEIELERLVKALINDYKEGGVIANPLIHRIIDGVEGLKENDFKIFVTAQLKAAARTIEKLAKEKRKPKKEE
ncbi:MAG: hypothetical protein COT89_01255 [Candidatus Colwellbacteria bacterium CG10_big_fil_rev_8_21_14_0_10_42_22]|uniref:Uncharacterized protein n=1 Tax=Candidatus Colwellbacteria bacterium CG10_big_fil_rev_8_21_14_0_10_42_22 TaxID=1974540 RepID=A0A2H0VIB0_9BACT|nr:MAG: hypothetical protein COT89_01255 [Candidatus Colwellbacteria bacterium CG10_big_fil_rev_8_21_14_0_10_42_22]